MMTATSCVSKCGSPPPPIARRLVAEHLRTGPPAPARRLLDRLTQRETQVLRTLAPGRTNAEVARDLGISEATVKTHVAHLLDKLEARDRIQLVVFAHTSGLATAP
jgi:DNA-binding NarL/FixJ family response regulator